MNVLFYLSLGGGGGGGGRLKFCLSGNQTSIVHFCRQIFHIFNGCKVTVVKTRKFMSCLTGDNL